MHSSIAFRATIVILVAGLLASCGGESEVDINKRDQASANLETIWSAYRQATEQGSAPPMGPDDLAEYLPNDVDQSKVFRSNRDGKSFVIIWGTDFRKAPTSGTRPLVIGYEKDGASGNRLVMTAMGVMTMSDDEFDKAYFPSGHNP